VRAGDDRLEDGCCGRYSARASWRPVILSYGFKMSEKNTIRNAIITNVTSRIIVYVLIGLAVLFGSWFMGWLVTFFHWLWSAATFLGAGAVHRVEIPAWLLAIFAIPWIILVIGTVHTLRRKYGPMSYSYSFAIFHEMGRGTSANHLE